MEAQKNGKKNEALVIDGKKHQQAAIPLRYFQVYKAT